jgi:chemotaxis protein CheX
MSQICVEDVVSMVITAASEVFGTMLNLKLESAPMRIEPVHPTAYDGVVALIGVGGPWTGTGRISCSPEFACKMAGALLMGEFEAVDEDVMDAVAEVANMVVGNVKTLLEERVGPLTLSLPTVIYGRNYKTRSSGVMEWTVVPFDCDGEALEVRFNLMETPVVAHPMMRPEHFHV